MSLKKHTAPGQAAAFPYQFERMMYWLAKSPSGYIVGIETEDDISVKGSNGSLILEQDKHSIQSDAKPFSDRSIDLWKTLSIWIEALDNEEVDAYTTTFFMVTNKLIPDCIANQIGLAKTDEQVNTCVKRLESIAKEPPKHVAAFMDRVLKNESRINLNRIIKKCQVVGLMSDGEDGDLRKETIAQLQLPEWCTQHANSIADELLGWLNNTVLSIWQKAKPAWIERNHFINQLHAIIDQKKRQIRRERAAHLIPVTDEKIGSEKGSPFVKQIYLITDDDDIVDNAIREFIRCNIEKLRLSAEGNVTDDDWMAFETTLEDRWGKIQKRIIRMSHEKDDEDIGFEIFSETTENYKEKLAGIDTEQVYLTSGTYHRLANLIKIGWHPRFKDLMREEIEC